MSDHKSVSSTLPVPNYVTSSEKSEELSSARAMFPSNGDIKSNLEHSKHLEPSPTHSSRDRGLYYVRIVSDSKIMREGLASLLQTYPNIEITGTFSGEAYPGEIIELSSGPVTARVLVLDGAMKQSTI